MAEKILNTRVLLKYDTLENWNSSSLILKRGELAIVTLGTTVDGTTAGEVNQHPVLFKVGDNAHTFAQLPYASALAADVYAWAKADNVVRNGKKLQFMSGETVVKEVEFNYITSDEATTLINNALAAYSTTTQMNAAIKVETDRAEAAEKALGERIDAFNLPENGFASKDEFDALKEKVEDEDGALAKANTNEGNIAKIVSGETVVGKATADGNGNVIATYYAPQSTTYTKTEVDGLVAPLATTEALNGVKATAEQGVADAATAQAAAEAAQATADAAKGRIDTFLDTEGVADTVDSLHDIKAWMEGTGVDATELTEAIAAEAKLREEGDALKVDKTVYDAHIEAYEAHITAQDARDDAQDEKIAALEAKPFDTYATKTEVSEAKSGAEATAAADATEKANKALADAKDYTDNALAGVQGTINSAVQTISTPADADGEPNGLKAVKTGTDVAISIDDSVTFVFDCGSSAL